MDNQIPEPSPLGDHRRQWRDCLYVYPVIARRSGGLSIGINLNSDKRCNYACIYCQIDRHVAGLRHEVQLPVLHDELQLVLTEAVAGRLWNEERFRSTPKKLRRINDIAFSGDGEPTCAAEFDKAVAVAADARKHFQLDRAKLVVITNATHLDSPQFARALPILDANNGEIWAKLDAGTDEYFHQVNRPHPKVPLDQIVADIANVAKGRPVVIQTLFMNVNGSPPPADELAAYCGRLEDILAAGGKIKLVQVHTIARQPAEGYAAPLSGDDLDAIARLVQSQVDGVKVETYYGAVK